MESWEKEIQDHNQALIKSIEGSTFTREGLVKAHEAKLSAEKKDRIEKALEVIEKSVQDGLISEEVFLGLRDKTSDDTLFKGLKYGN